MFTLGTLNLNTHFASAANPSADLVSEPTRKQSGNNKNSLLRLFNTLRFSMLPVSA